MIKNPKVDVQSPQEIEPIDFSKDPNALDRPGAKKESLLSRLFEAIKHYVRSKKRK